MMDDLSMLLSLRKVLESAGEGRGVAESAVRELRGAGRPGEEAAARVLLGMPLGMSLRPLQEGGGSEVSMLASLIENSRKSSASRVGKGGEALSYTLERWAKEKENRLLTAKVMSFRSLISSGVLGGICSMVATLGPVLGSLNFLTRGATTETGLVYAAATMVFLSSGMLGLFTSGRRFYQNVMVSAVAFFIVHLLVAPLADVSGVSLLGIK
jgi:hypothetical protein